MADQRRPRTRFRTEILRPTTVQVVQVSAVGEPRPGVVRVELPASEHWVSTGFDDVVVLCLPDRHDGRIRLPIPLEGGGLASPGGDLPVREYTVVDLGERLVLDLVRHDTGPGSDWAGTVAVGDRVGVVGPRLIRGVPRAESILAVGDVTAWPALARLLREWPEAVRGTLVGIFEEGWGVDDLPDPPDGVEVHVLTSSGDSAQDVALVVERLTRCRWDQTGFAWVAGEAGLATGLRRWLVGDAGLARDQIQFTGYWRRECSAGGH